jgi:hypothetical protein
MDTLIDVPFYGNLILCVLQDSPFPHPERAQRLLLGTVAQESNFRHTRQLGGGPARGLMQMEPFTERSVWHDYLATRPHLVAYITSRCGQRGPNAYALEYNMAYGILLMRTLYFWRDKATMPEVDDIEEAARRYKRYYNTPGGKGTEREYIANYQQYIQPYYHTPPSTEVLYASHIDPFDPTARTRRTRQPSHTREQRKQRPRGQRAAPPSP